MKYLIAIICLAAIHLHLAGLKKAHAQGSASLDAATGIQSDWVRTGKSRYDWKWLAKQCDHNSDAQILPDEFPLSQQAFAHLDRNWDGRLTSEDFDWDQEGILCTRKETTFALFKSVDQNSDGRITQDEWSDLFAHGSNGQEYLDAELLEKLIYLPRVIKTAKENQLRARRTEFSPDRLAGMKVPQPGDLAPDFELSSPDTQTTVRLSALRGRPVVLVFGCYTCGNYRTYSESMEKLYRFWKDDADFLRVYVREAHPVSGGQAATSTNFKAGILFEQPETIAERCTIADTFVKSLNVTTPLVVDGIDNKVSQIYGGWPDRLYVVDRDGRIAFTGGPGPFGFNPREMEQALAMLLIDQPSVANSAH